MSMYRTAAAAVLGAFLAMPVHAQLGGLGIGAGNAPMEVIARNGIEWDRTNQRYIARGDAQVTYNNNVIQAEELIAYYRQKPDGNSDIFRLDATGNVRITTPQQRVSGDKVVYDSDTAVLVITGRAVKLTTATEEVTARDSLEYWEAKRLAVARGDATIVTGDRRIRADVLSGYFSADPSQPKAAPKPPPKPAAKPAPTARNQRGRPAATQAAAPGPGGLFAGGGDQSNIERVEFFGNVLVSSKSEIVRGDRGVYNAKTGLATIAGNVRITQGGTQQATGDYAEFDLKSGQSRLLAKPGGGGAGGGDGRVRLLLVPGQTPGPAGPAKRLP